MKIVTVVGARPQFIKAAAVSRAIRGDAAGRVQEVLVHTGQHYDSNMSAVFFEELGIPAPAHHLEISGGGHGAMTGRMLQALEAVLADEKPDWVLVYGDTNSTLAAALAAVKMHIPLAHVEAGLRSFNMRMPEEVNRIVADRVSTLLFCPTQVAVENLRNEGMTHGVHLVGDVMFDVSLYYRDLARRSSDAVQRFGLEEGGYVLTTCHRAENTDDPVRLASILGALGELAEELPVVLPVHPRTRNIIRERGMADVLGKVRVVDPLSFMDMVRLEQSARVVVTDSGGVQKEAFFYQVPCVTMRDETEWTETVDLGWNQLVGADRGRIVAAVRGARPPAGPEARPYGDGAASQAILQKLLG
ncbi:non-hydrolyzing UDP-N-acetylglucosamine 2-epimerase [Ramlibacter pallidus]|uniref:UDP-N-acetylglucosamine 2-epimerase (Non-hydrolyzing) n=1 Tax=Ramlibacter pallidus TaxID=2780087 RepID=A0ABR9RYG8_9BURK|nr:UDP-N-acetylglucosamine 2-epimerase (non-hydrolyzing) [Ramlibacter pallidus]MBE7366269.1 UDP-N-acetylglucosamine 2-epimerase (non-hydrolyzing) [Ramlibacter pallidus]